MTNKTKPLSIRLNTEDKEVLSKYITRESLESILRQIKDGEIEITAEGVVFKRVNTISESVNTDVNTYEYDDPDGEWVRDIAHELNIGVKDFKRRIEQSIRR